MRSKLWMLEALGFSDPNQEEEVRSMQWMLEALGFTRKADTDG